ncbi:hypothetical protein L1887_26748 [Cichorium endivia]|nr:hypothetical protein L1887_26748 [Cichorium endivia]
MLRSIVPEVISLLFLPFCPSYPAQQTRKHVSSHLELASSLLRSRSSLPFTSDRRHLEKPDAAAAVLLSTPVIAGSSLSHPVALLLAIAAFSFCCVTSSRLNFTMNKGGAGGGTSGAGGPTAAAAAAAAQKQKSLQQRVDNDIASIVDNFSIVVNVARVNDPPVRNSQEAFMMEVRASRMVQAADSLLKLVSELKQTAIFSGFASLNDHVEQRTEELNHQAEKTDKILAKIGEDAAGSLKEMESHYYSSVLRSKSNLHLHE